ncbi:MAG: hypothetical protein ACKVOY_07505 [Burkholderiaceae bacterium]
MFHIPTSNVTACCIAWPLRTEERNGANVTVVKTALQIIGNDCGHVRPPGAWPLANTAREKLIRFFEN